MLIMHHQYCCISILWVDFINEAHQIMSASQDHESCRELALSTNFLTFVVLFNYLNLFCHQITAVLQNIGTPALQNLVNLRMCVNIFNMH